MMSLRKKICSTCKKFKPVRKTPELALPKGVWQCSSSPFIQASCIGHHNCVEAFITAGADVNEKDDAGLTPLIGACRNGQTKCVDILIASGADLNKYYDQGNTPLIVSILQNRKECVDALLAAGADSNKSNNEGATPLIVASEVGKINYVKAFIDAGADVNKTNNTGLTPLIGACKNGQAKCVDILIAAGADLNKSDDQGDTPLIASIAKYHKDCVDALLTAGVDQKKPNNRGTTPLIVASEVGDITCVKTFIDAGADVNEANAAGTTPLISASKFINREGDREKESGRIIHMRDPSNVDNIECVNALITAGANVNAARHDGKRALHFAGVYGNISVISALIAAGANVNAVSGVGETSLSLATRKTTVMKALIAAGADVNLSDNKRLTPLMKTIQQIEQSNRSCDVDDGSYNVLIAAGADVNSINEDGITALHISLFKGNFSCFYALIEAGADVNIVNAKGNTLLSYAVRMRRSLVPEILLKGAKVNVTTPNTLQRLIIREKQIEELKNKDDCMLLYAAGERVKDAIVFRRGAQSRREQVPVPGYLLFGEDLKLNLKHLCREVIRKHLLRMSKVNLFVRIPLLGLPSLVTEYLLYNVESTPMVKRKMFTMTTKQ